MGIRELYNLYIENFLVDTDTRKIRPETIFFALKGDNFNGNEFAEQALHKGARYCVIDEAEYSQVENTILVKDVLKTLQELANYHRKQLSIPILALTGSNGKTTTKELINSVLSTQYITTATLGNLNNHIGVPLTLLSITDKTEIGIVEMGANHLKEIEFLSEIAEPDLGYITNFGKAHLEGFGGIEGVIKGKSELYNYLRSNGKMVFVNPNDKKQVELTENHERTLLNNTLKIVSTHPYLKINYKSTIIHTHLVGEYNFSNIQAATSIGEYFKINESNIVKALENYIPSNNRSQIIENGTNTIILDAYNANPSSTELALKNFSQIDSSSKIAILGDMFELGEEAETEHQYMVDFSNSLNINQVIFVGSNYYKTNAVEKFTDFEALKESISKTTFKDSSILIKGSRGMALERLLDFIN
ncbi:MAG: UDP-N-acetylmuramoyl-tripeptide--D-alanyl-D-alanine ligase [Flavobacteriaceae bacterium]